MEKTNEPTVAGLTNQQIAEIGLANDVQAFRNEKFRMARCQGLTAPEREEYAKQVAFARAIESAVLAPLAPAGLDSLPRYSRSNGNWTLADYYLAADVECWAASHAATAVALTDEQITTIARDAIRAGTLNWAGYNKDDNGLYTVPAISPMEFALCRAVLASHAVAGAEPAELPPLTLSVYGTMTALELERQRRADIAARIAAATPSTAAVRAAEWVSVDERLPEDGQTVAILYWPYGNHENSQVAGAAEHIEGVFYTHEGDDHHPPSHWAPIPNVPAAPIHQSADGGNGGEE